MRRFAVSCYLLIKRSEQSSCSCCAAWAQPLEGESHAVASTNLHMFFRLHGLNPLKVTPMQRIMLLFVMVIRSKLLNNIAFMA